MVGDSACGKTSLVLRFDQNVFSTKFVTTIGVDYRDKMIKVRCIRTAVVGCSCNGMNFYPRVALDDNRCGCVCDLAFSTDTALFDIFHFVFVYID